MKSKRNLTILSLVLGLTLASSGQISRSEIQEFERARVEFEEYKSNIEAIKSVHRSCSEEWDWQGIVASEPPVPPQYQTKNEAEALKARNDYRPSFLGSLLGNKTRKINNLIQKVAEAKELDQKEFETAQNEYQQNRIHWEKITEIGRGIASGDLVAYKEAIRYIKPFEGIKEIGSPIEFQLVSGQEVHVTFFVYDESIIPKEEKRLLMSGKLFVRPIPQTKIYEIYQDYVCGCVLRIARELFSLLPIDMTMVTAKGDVHNRETGYVEEQPILSVAIPKRALAGLNFSSIDPSDSMKIFLHKMNFNKAAGFMPVENIKRSDGASDVEIVIGYPSMFELESFETGGANCEHRSSRRSTRRSSGGRSGCTDGGH